GPIPRSRGLPPAARTAWDGKQYLPHQDQRRHRQQRPIRQRTPCSRSSHHAGPPGPGTGRGNADRRRAPDAVLRPSGIFTWGELTSLRRVLMRLWCRCFGPGRSLGLVLGGGRLGGRFAVTGRGGPARLPGSVGSEGEAGDCADRGERGRGEQDVVEPAGGAGAGGGGHRGAGSGRGHGGYPGAGAGGTGGRRPVAGARAGRGAAGGGGRASRACRGAVVTREVYSAPSTATPVAMPTWRSVFTRPAAIPAWAGSTADSAAEARPVEVTPRPIPARRNPGSST